MPAKFDLTWDGNNARWRVMFRGKRYVVSCRQLGVPTTKEASYQAANLWWRSKLSELNTMPVESPHPHQSIIDHLDRRIDWARRNGLEDVVENSENARYMALSADEMTTEDITPFIEINSGRLPEWSEVIGDNIPGEETLKGLAERY